MREKEVIAAGYCRVSTPMQVDGLSLDVQQEQVEKYIRSRGWKTYKIFIETGYSGKDFERPRFQEMLRHLRAGKFGIIVVPKIDRFARNIRLLLEIVENDLKPNNVQLVSVSENIDTTSPSGNALFQIMGIFAAMERERIVERITEGHRKKATVGPPSGRTTGYKFDSNRNYQIFEKEAKVIRQIFRMYVNDGLSITEIVTKLKEKEVRSLQGKFMGKRSIRYILGNEAYTGKFVYGRKTNGGNKLKEQRPEEEHIVAVRKDLAIISDEMFLKAKQKIAASKKRNKRTTSSLDVNHVILEEENLLVRGIMKCGNCGGNMGINKVKTTRENTTHISYAYSCIQKSNYGAAYCSSSRVNAKVIDKIIEDNVVRLLNTKEHLRAIKNRIKQMSKPHSADQKKEIAGFKAKVAKLNEKLARINSLGAATRLIESQSKQKSELEKEKMKLLLTIADMEMEMIQNEAPLFDDEHFEILSGDFERTFNKFQPDKKRTVIASIVKKVVIKDREVVSVEFHPPFDIENTGHFDER